MIIDFGGRFQAAFGFIAGNVSASLLQGGFGNVIEEKPGILGVYVMDKSTTFDEILLYHDKEQYLFAYKSISDDYTGVFATPPMLSFKRAKKLVITQIDNSDIEVVERYGTEPWEVQWRGLLIDMENHEFPIDKMKTLNQIFEKNDVWNVASEIMQANGIEAIYIKDISIDFVEGFEDTISYTMTTRQIRPLEYQILN
jgi:hypothetical protein